MSFRDDFREPAPEQAPEPKSASVPPVTFRLSRLAVNDRWVGAATLVTMISVWLPFYTISAAVYGEGASLSATFHTWMWLEVLAALALLAYLTARAMGVDATVTLPLTHEKRLVAVTFVQLALVLMALIAIPYGDLGFGLGWAAYLGLMAALIAFLVPVVPVLRSRRSST